MVTATELEVDNRDTIEAWNTILFDNFVRYRELLVDALGSHGTRAIDRHPPPKGGRVIDIGCGFGDTTAELARRAGPFGFAVGVDAAARFIAQARRENADLDNVRFEVCDVEQHLPAGPYDLAYSRLGTMFFARPVIALANIRRVLAPGGRLCMVVWRRKDANEGVHRVELAVRALLGDPARGEQVTCGPGPFSMASADLVGDQLIAAGFRDPCFERSDAPLLLGRTLDDAVAVTLDCDPAGELARLAGDAARARRAEITAVVRDALAPWVRADGVWTPSSCWIVTASA